jgi:hypothetical protein
MVLPELDRVSDAEAQGNCLFRKRMLRLIAAGRFSNTA